MRPALPDDPFARAAALGIPLWAIADQLVCECGWRSPEPATSRNAGVFERSWAVHRHFLCKLRGEDGGE